MISNFLAVENAFRCFAKMMKIIRTMVLVIGISSASVFGWIVEEPIDFPKQMQSADFVGIVEVTKVLETGRKKVLYDGGVHFRELTLEFKVMSVFKGQGKAVTCRIYREPTREELIADGLDEDEVRKVLLNLGTDEALHLFPARVAQGDQLLVYLRSTEETCVPVTGDLKSSHALLRLEPSNMINTPVRKHEAEVIIDPSHLETPASKLKASAPDNVD
jgi:hypothetical protein